MTLLERFRAQPRQKHADPAVRLTFVQEIPITEREVLAEIAREDADVRVRRAAVAKLMDPGALASIAQGDGDESVREQAIAMLRDLALESFEGVTEADSLAAVDALSRINDSKALASVAKGAASDTVAMRARAGISDVHMLGSIARHAGHEPVRVSAFDALADDREILSVAMNSEFREPALRAVERIGNRRDLEQIAARARNKSAAKRARAIVREMDEREAQEREAAAAAAAADRAAREEAVARLQVAAREEADRQAALEREAAERAAADQAAAQAAARAEADSERDRQDRAAAERDAERARTRLEELADEAARLAAAEEVHGVPRQIGAIRREWSDLSRQTEPSADAAAKYAAAEAAFAAREQAAREEDQRVRRDALARLQQLAARIEPLAARDDLSLRAGERALRDVRGALGAMPQLPSKKDYDEIMHRLKAAQSSLTPKVQELREVAGWQRWANVGIQEQLVEKMEALKAADDPEHIARQVKDLQQQWRQAADVPRAQGELLWRRFKAAHDEVWAKCEAYFAAQAVARSENLARKIALCERAEALADSSSWIQTAEEIKRLQTDWKGVGPVSRGQEKAVWERFRTACDRFFTRRHADLAQRKALWSENLARKEALIARVETLAGSTEWEPTAAEIKRIQAEWRTIGPVKKSRSEALWQRFRAACDQFFSRYAQRHDFARGERVAAREAIVADLEALSAGDEPPGDLTATVRSIRGRWAQEIAARGVDRERAAALDERFASAFNRVTARWPAAFAGTDLDPDANRKRMESIVRRIEELAASLAGSSDPAADAGVSPTTRLAAMLKEALAANTIGGKVDNESRFRAATEEVRHAQANWSRIGPVPDEFRRALADRLQRAIRRITEKAAQAGRTAAEPSGHARAGQANMAGTAGDKRH